MFNKLFLLLAPVILGLISSLAFLTSYALAQSADREKPKLKDFGSSLRRLKWDEQKQVAVEASDAGERRDEAAGEDVVHIETRLVACGVLVLDRRGNAVEGLTQDDFLITEDGQPQRISHYSLGSEVKVGRSIVLILDYSSSLLPFIETSTEAAKALVDKLGPKDRMAVVTDDVSLLVDFTSDKAKLKEALDSLKRKTTSGQSGRSVQFSALMATLREIFDEEDIRPIVVFQTDGDELPFLQPAAPDLLKFPQVRGRVVQFSLGDVDGAAERSRATIYSVIPGVRLIGFPPEEQARRADIYIEKQVRATHNLRLKTNPSLPPPRIVPLMSSQSAGNAKNVLSMQQAVAGVAEITGGQIFFLEEPGQAGEIYSRILSDINRRYLIGYYPTNKATDGKRHRVLIEVRNHPDYTVWGRKSYYAPGPLE
jgi:VWFA-related protein